MRFELHHEIFKGSGKKNILFGNMYERSWVANMSIGLHESKIITEIAFSLILYNFSQSKF